MYNNLYSIMKVYLNLTMDFLRRNLWTFVFLFYQIGSAVSMMGGEGAMDYRQKARGITVAFVEFIKKRNKCVETTVQS